MLEMTEIESKLASDFGMYFFNEGRMRGRISYISKRISKANNKYMQSYDNKKPNKYITYVDENNLYGWTMSQYLPNSGFK